MDRTLTRSKTSELSRPHPLSNSNKATKKKGSQPHRYCCFKRNLSAQGTMEVGEPPSQGLDGIPVHDDVSQILQIHPDVLSEVLEELAVSQRELGRQCDLYNYPTRFSSHGCTVRACIRRYCPGAWSITHTF